MITTLTGVKWYEERNILSKLYTGITVTTHVHRGHAVNNWTPDLLVYELKLIKNVCLKILEYVSGVHYCTYPNTVDLKLLYVYESP